MIILHNIVIDVEGCAGGIQFLGDHGHVEEAQDREQPAEHEDDDKDIEEQGKIKRQRLIDELLAHRGEV